MKRKFDKVKFQRRLIEIGATKECERCGHNQFSSLNKFTFINMQEDLGKYDLGENPIPAGVLICSNCGAITFHALGALGLLEEDENE